MEEPQHCLWIAAHRDREMVYSKRRFLRMAIIWTELAFVGSWQTCVVSLMLSLRLMTSHSQRAQGRASFGTLIFLYLFHNDLTCRSVPRSSKTSFACRNRDLHHWRFFIATLERTKKRMSVGCSHHGFSNFLVNLAYTVTPSPTCTWNMTMVQGNPVTTHLSSV